MTALQLAVGWAFGIALLALWAEVAFLLVSKHPPGPRARFWNMTLLLALALPAFFVLPGSLPTDTDPAPVRLFVVMAQESAASIQRAPATLVNTVFLAWAIVAAVFLARLARSGRQLAALTRSARPIAAGSDAAFPVLESERVKTPSASFIGGAILVPPSFRSMPDYWRRAILAHESIHLARRHGLALVAEEVVRALFWFHPLMWRLITRVRHSREEAVDAETVATVGDPAAYRELLISLATRSHTLAPAVSGAASLCARLRSLASLEKRSMPNLATVRVLCASLSMLGVTVSASAITSPAMVTTPSADDGTQRSAQKISLAERLKVGNVSPIYPEGLKGKNLSGIVLLEIVINPAGVVTGITPVKTESTAKTDPAFVQAAITAVRLWTYKPADVTSRMTIALDFRTK